MEVNIILKTNNSALSDVKLAQLIEVLQNTKDVNLKSTVSDDSEKISRFGAMELIAAFISSTAAYQLASALRDFVKRQSVDITLSNKSGKRLVITAKGGDPNAIADIVGYITKQHEKESQSFKQTNEQISRVLDNGLDESEEIIKKSTNTEL